MQVFLFLTLFLLLKLLYMHRPNEISSEEEDVYKPVTFESEKKPEVTTLSDAALM